MNVGPFKDCQELLTDSSAKKLMLIFLNFLTELVCTHIDISLLNYINGSLLLYTWFLLCKSHGWP